jgi:hypothetical protein
MFGCRQRVILAGIGLVIASLATPPQAEAYERQWRLSADVGYALAGFADTNVSGFAAGGHLSYGISDAFNLRLSADFGAFDLPQPSTAAFLFAGAVGAEYVFDVLDWVPYVGASVGALDVSIQDGAHHPALLIEFPLGVGYQLSRSAMLGFEARYRLLPLRDESIPSHNMLALGTLAYTWGF